MFVERTLRYTILRSIIQFFQDGEDRVSNFVQGFNEKFIRDELKSVSEGNFSQLSLHYKNWGGNTIAQNHA